MKPLLTLLTLLLTLPALAEEARIDKLGLTVHFISLDEGSGAAPAGKKQMVATVRVSAGGAITIKHEHLKLKCGDIIISGTEGAPSPLSVGKLSAGGIFEGGVLFTVASSAKTTACQLAWSSGEASSSWLKPSPAPIAIPKYKLSKGTLAIPGAACLDGVNLETGAVDAINLWAKQEGGAKVETFTHGAGYAAQILEAPAGADGRAKVRVGEYEGWMHESFLVPPPSTPVKFKGTKGTLAIPGKAFVDGVDPASSLTVDPINLWAASVGGRQAGTLRHAGGTVDIIAPPCSGGERVHIRTSSGLDGWLHEAFLTPKDNTPKPTTSTTTSTKTSHSGRPRRRRR